MLLKQKTQASLGFNIIRVFFEPLYFIKGEEKQKTQASLGFNIIRVFFEPLYFIKGFYPSIFPLKICCL